MCQACAGCQGTDMKKAQLKPLLLDAPTKCCSSASERSLHTHALTPAVPCWHGATDTEVIS